MSVDVVPLHTVTKAVTGGIAFAVGKTLDVNPRVKLGKLPVKVRHCPGPAGADDAFYIVLTFCFAAFCYNLRLCVETERRIVRWS